MSSRRDGHVRPQKKENCKCNCREFLRKPQYPTDHLQLESPADLYRIRGKRLKHPGAMLRSLCKSVRGGHHRLSTAVAGVSSGRRTEVTARGSHMGRPQAARSRRYIRTYHTRTHNVYIRPPTIVTVAGAKAVAQRGFQLVHICPLSWLQRLENLPPVATSSTPTLLPSSRLQCCFYCTCDGRRRLLYDGPDEQAPPSKQNVTGTGVHRGDRSPPCFAATTPSSFRCASPAFTASLFLA